MKYNTRNRWIGLVAAFIVAAVLGGVAGRPVAAENPYNARPMVAELLELYAFRVQGMGGADDTYLKADGVKIWGKESDEGERHYLDVPPLVFWGSIDITLMEEDSGLNGGDDTLGRLRIYGSDYERKYAQGYAGLLANFRQDDAVYHLVYRVRPATREEIGVSLRPAHDNDKCVDAPGPQWVVSGANLQQWHCYLFLNQLWRFKPAGPDYFLITGTYNNRHLCLDVEGNSTSNGALVQQSDCHGKDNQLWRLVDMGNGRFQIVSKRSQKCLDVAWDNDKYAYSNGARIQQWECYGPRQLNQLWEMVQP